MSVCLCLCLYVFDPNKLSYFIHSFKEKLRRNCYNDSWVIRHVAEAEQASCEGRKGRRGKEKDSAQSRASPLAAFSDEWGWMWMTTVLDGSWMYSFTVKACACSVVQG